METRNPIKKLRHGRKEARAFRDERQSIDDEASSSPERRERQVPEIYQVLIECRNEADQELLFERMRAEGYRCRVLTL